jgi:membrane protease YdiL (CAAX protease family)
MFSADKPLPKMLYLLGVIVIYIAVYSQYFVELRGLTGYLVVYGIPVLVVSLFFGKEILGRAGKNNKLAAKLGLGMFGGLTLVSLFISVIVIAVLLQFDQSTLDVLSKPNPVLEVPSNVAWVMIVISFLVIGPAEEYLFRGFMYGGLLSMTKGKHWLPLAIGASVLFASVHAYYAVTYGVVSVVPFIALVTFSIAMSITYYYTGGNLLVAVLIHGAYDATGFLTVAVSAEVGLAARGILIFVGAAFAIYFLLKKLLTGHALSGSLFGKNKSQSQPFPSSPPPTS